MTCASPLPSVKSRQPRPNASMRGSVSSPPHGGTDGVGLGRPDALSGEQMFQRQFLGDSDTDAIQPERTVHYGRVCSGRLGYGEHRSTRIQAPRA